MTSTPERIHIIGGPGTGKSTLARALGGQLEAPVYALDEVAFWGPHFAERPAAERLARVQEIAQGARWITEGIFVDWIDELVRAADCIVWLDNLPWHRTTWRIVTRFARHGWTEAASRRGRERYLRFEDYRRHLGQLVEVMRANRDYYVRERVRPSERGRVDGRAGGDIRHVTRAGTAEYLMPYMGKVIRASGSRALLNLAENGDIHAP